MSEVSQAGIRGGIDDSASPTPLTVIHTSHYILAEHIPESSDDSCKEREVGVPQAKCADNCLVGRCCMCSNLLSDGDGPSADIWIPAKGDKCKSVSPCTL